MNLTLTRIGRVALDLLYPPRCVLCSQGGEFVCVACLATLPRADGARCDACWLAIEPSRECRRCAERPPVLSHLRSVWRYEGDVRRLVHAFKFSGHSCLAEPLAAEMLPLIEDMGLVAGVLVPVPLSGRRQRQRGFNQAALLARALGKHLEEPAVETLARRRFAGAQARTVSAEERRRNVEGAFEIRLPGIVNGRHVLLIDDVATTGATLDACARVLLNAGAAAVSALTLARED